MKQIWQQRMSHATEKVKKLHGGGSGKSSLELMRQHKWYWCPSPHEAKVGRLRRRSEEMSKEDIKSNWKRRQMKTKMRRSVEGCTNEALALMEGCADKALALMAARQRQWEGCANEAYTPRVQGWQEDCCCSNMLDAKTRRTGSSNSLLDTKTRKTGRHNSLWTFVPTPKDSLETNRMTMVVPRGGNWCLNPCRRLQCSAKKKKRKQISKRQMKDKSKEHVSRLRRRKW